VKVGASRLEDRLAPWEPPYKSRGEAQVGRLLDRYGIPFFYESPWTVHDDGRQRTWHPYVELNIMWSVTSCPFVSSLMRTGTASGIFT
jgi:hypothetical protein